MNKQSGVCRYQKPPKGFKRARHLVINTCLVLIITIWVIYQLKVSVSPEHRKLSNEDIKETADMMETKEKGMGALKFGRKGLILAGDGGEVGESEESDESNSVETGEDESSNNSQADEKDDEEEELATELLDDLTEEEAYSHNDANSASI